MGTSKDWTKLNPQMALIKRKPNQIKQNFIGYKHRVFASGLSSVRHCHALRLKAGEGSGEAEARSSELWEEYSVEISNKRLSGCATGIHSFIHILNRCLTSEANHISILLTSLPMDDGFIPPPPPSLPPSLRFTRPPPLPQSSPRRNQSVKECGGFSE